MFTDRNIKEKILNKIYELLGSFDTVNCQDTTRQLESIRMNFSGYLKENCGYPVLVMMAGNWKQSKQSAERVGI